jgi:predicted transposase YdaD
MAHPSLKLAEIVLKALKGRLEQDQARLYCEAVMRALTLKDRSTLEAKMNKGIVYRSAYARKYLDEGHEKGLEKGMTKGMAKGRKEGRKEGRQEGMAEAQRTLQQTAMQLARLKLEDITREEQAALSTMRDTKVLSGLVLQLAKAKQPQQARKALAKAELAARKKQEKSGRGAEQSSLAFA